MVQKAITKIASLFSPVGAVVQLGLTVWDVFQTLKDEFSRIFGLVTTVVDEGRWRLGPSYRTLPETLARIGDA